MFGPVRGAWPDDSWKGWWGPKPPYHTPVFVLTHHPRESVAMEGGTTFHFVTDGIHAALERARAAAGGRDVRLGGGVASVQQYLRAAPGWWTKCTLALVPAVLGAGEALLAGIDLGKLGYACTRHVGTQAAMHVRATRAAHGLPIDQAARACGVSVGMLSKLENGKGVHLDYVLRTLDGLGLTMLVVPKDHVPLLERAASHAARESKACEVGRARDLEWD